MLPNFSGAVRHDATRRIMVAGSRKIREHSIRLQLAVLNVYMVDRLPYINGLNAVELSCDVTNAPLQKGTVQDTHHEPQRRLTYAFRQSTNQIQAADLSTVAARVVQGSSIW